ncbi:UNVERIFIED_CONTAM: hypothetical protein RMT77_007388 [Armadillidium vulgare]
MPSANSVTSSSESESTDINRVLVHNSLGLKFHDGPPNFIGNSSKFENVEGKVKFLTISDNGKRIAWIIDGVVCVVESPEWKRIGTLQHPKAAEISFSPNGNFLAVWDIYSQVQGATPTQNLCIYDVTRRNLLKSFVQKSHEGWQPQWTKDETIMARTSNNEVHFYEGTDFNKFKEKKSLPKLKSFSLSPSVGTSHYVVFFVPSLKAAPAYVQLFKYPQMKDNSSVIAYKSFFKVDSIEYFWNRNCSSVLLLTTAEVDKSGTSYYGEQMLFYLNNRGDSIRVTFSKQGNIRSVAWCPSGKEFFCVYGTSPARATIFNLKCDAVAEFGEGARNIVLINPQGNLVLLGGMGNISSRFEIWDVKENKQVGHQECSDITHMEWSPCGRYILTSTCSPRLRVNNGYKIWHYTTSLLYESLCSGSEELYCGKWLPNHDLATPFEISSTPVKGIQSQVKKASTQRYIPPSQRLAASGEGGKSIDTTKKFLSQREDPFVKEEVEKDPKEMQKEKRKQKQKLKREEAKKKKEEEKGMHRDWREPKEETEKQSPKQEPKKENAAKRIKNIKKKLESIETLKKEQSEGKFLDKGQVDKIESEISLLEELKGLEGLSVS